MSTTSLWSEVKYQNLSLVVTCVGGCSRTTFTACVLRKNAEDKEEWRQRLEEVKVQKGCDGLILFVLSRLIMWRHFTWFMSNSQAVVDLLKISNYSNSSRCWLGTDPIYWPRNSSSRIPKYEFKTPCHKLLDLGNGTYYTVLQIWKIVNNIYLDFIYRNIIHYSQISVRRIQN